MKMLRKTSIFVVQKIFQAIYFLCSLRGRRDEVIFLSRQADKPNINFLLIGEEFEQRGWSAIYLCKKFSKRKVFSYTGHVVKQISALARCRVCVLDRYDPVVGLLNLECEVVQEPPVEGVHFEFPKKPVVIQLWHAFGAFKKFGFQSHGTTEGHSTDLLHTLGIHRNYSWIVCSGAQNREIFAEAFCYPEERIVNFGLPEYDELTALGESCENRGGEESAEKPRLKVLFAPTLRKSESSAHPFKDLHEAWGDVPISGVSAKWSFHPLEAGLSTPVDASRELIDADYVVTDYSSIVYEAYLLGKKALFYVPDLEAYRLSPGLNTDPALRAPGITFYNREDLQQYLELAAEGIVEYSQEDFDSFIGETFSSIAPGVASHITSFILSKI